MSTAARLIEALCRACGRLERFLTACDATTFDGKGLSEKGAQLLLKCELVDDDAVGDVWDEQRVAPSSAQYVDLCVHARGARATGPRLFVELKYVRLGFMQGMQGNTATRAARLSALDAQVRRVARPATWDEPVKTLQYYRKPSGAAARSRGVAGRDTPPPYVTLEEDLRRAYTQIQGYADAVAAAPESVGDTDAIVYAIVMIVGPRCFVFHADTAAGTLEELDVDV